MKGRLTAIKNIAWAFAIVICLLAVFVGLLFAAFTRSNAEQFRGSAFNAEHQDEDADDTTTD